MYMKVGYISCGCLAGRHSMIDMINEGLMYSEHACSDARGTLSTNGQHLSTEGRVHHYVAMHDRVAS